MQDPSEFEVFVANLKALWMSTRPNTGLTFQEFLLALSLFKKEL